MQLTLDDRQHEHEDDDRLESTWDRWQRLPLAYRVNALMYVLGFISLVVLLAQVVSGGNGTRQVEVASRAPSSTRARPSTTVTTQPSTTLAPVSIPPTAPAAASASVPKLNSNPNPAQTNDTTPLNGFSPGAPPCSNSTDPQCGPFRWDPPVASNAPIVVDVGAEKSTADPNQWTFTVRVSDADHTVGDNCSVVDFGDGITQSAPCNTPSCPDVHGPWSTPAAVPGGATFTYSHNYVIPGSYTATFTFHTDRDRCPDPYGNFGSNSATVVVTPPTTPSTSAP